MFIYKATSITTGKVYIGQSCQTLEKRMSQHLSRAITNYDPNNHFHNAIRKYGFPDFVFQVIEDNITSDAVLNEREKYWIEYYNSYYDGYNSTLGGDAGLRRDDLVIEALFHDGYTTKEICEMTGYSRGTIYNSYKANGLQEENNKRKNEQTKLRCSEKVEQYSLDGKYLRTHSSASEAGRELGNQSAISAVCRQEEAALSAYGYLFKYADDPRDISEWVNRYNNKKTSGRPKKKIVQKDKNKNEIAIYQSAADAARALNLKDKSNICAAARKGNTAYGYYWEYIESEE